MSLAAVTRRTGKRKPRRWTPDRLWRLAELIERGYSDEEIARRLGATANAVMLARKRYGLKSRTAAAMTARAVARRLGIACSKTVTVWIERGWLKGKQIQGRGPYDQWHVSEDALIAFLENPEHWPRWQPERIPGKALREWALELRAGVRFLTTAEVAERFYVEPTTVNQWIHRGELPAVRNGNWLVRSDVLADFVPPGQRPRTSFTPADDELIVRMRAEGAYWREIAALLGRPETTVANRARQLERERSSGATSENAR